MEGSIFFVEKTSDTSADATLATGFASLLGDIQRKLYGTQEGIILRDTGPSFEITTPYTIEVSGLPSLSGIQIVLPLENEKQREKAKKGGKTLDGFDYDGQISRSKSYREQVSKLPAALRTADARLRKAPELMEIVHEEPDTRLSHYQTISSMKVVGSFNELALRWNELNDEQRRLHIALLFALFGQPENDIEAAVSAWQKMAKEQGLSGKALGTALQIVNPTTGKGANRTKANELSIGNQDSFWLLELLKFRGFMEAAAPLVIKESKDRKTYVLQPKQIHLDTLQTMMRELRAVLWPTSALKLDILASLRFARLLVRHYQELFKRDSVRKRRGRESIKSIAHGFEVTSYKDMGSAYATMNVALINFPDWLPLMERLEAVEAAGQLLDEHLKVVQSIRNHKGEEGAEEYELLRLYREFLSGNDLRPFWKFAILYGSYLMSQREKNPNRYMRPLHVQEMEVLLMSDPVNNREALEIVGNKGFQRIADAIRRATVFPQQRRLVNNDRRYEVRYGLGQELMRKARYKQEFLVALSEFLFAYNAETAQEDEKVIKELARNAHREMRALSAQERRTYYLRYMTSEDDLKEVVALVDRHGSEVVGSLLVACGYSFKGSTNDMPKQSEAAADGGEE